MAPDWRSEPWFPRMWLMVKKWKYFGIGTRMFELDGVGVNPLRRWGVWAMYLKGGEVNAEREQPRTRSSRRRHRRMWGWANGHDQGTPVENMDWSE